MPREIYQEASIPERILFKKKEEATRTKLLFLIQFSHKFIPMGKCIDFENL